MRGDFVKLVEETNKKADKKKCLFMFVDKVKGVTDLFKDHLKEICDEKDISFNLCEVDKTKITKTKLTCGKKVYDIDPSCTIFNLRTIFGIDLATKAQKLGYFVFNDPKTLDLATDKWESHKFLEDNKWPSPKTFKVITEEEVEEAAKKIKNYPMVMKIIGGAGGKGVQKCDDYDTLLAACQSIWEANKEGVCENEMPLLIQEMLDSKYDVRVNVIDGEMAHAAKRQSKSFRNNLSQDGTATDYRINKKHKKMCEDIAKKLKSEWLGVDLMFKGDKAYVLEFNTSPGIAVGKEKLGKAFQAFLVKKFEELA
jgi:RimK family alpha-L-glutamate ligase